MKVKFSRTVKSGDFFVDLFTEETGGPEFIIFHDEKWFLDNNAPLHTSDDVGWFAFYLIDENTKNEWRLDISDSCINEDGLFWNTAIHYPECDEPNAPCFSETRRYEDQEEYDPNSRFVWTLDDFKEPVKNPNTSSRNHPLFTDPTKVQEPKKRK